MRLLNILTFEFESFDGDRIPPYAILSHTWTAKEITHQDMISIDSATTERLRDDRTREPAPIMLNLAAMLPSRKAHSATHTRQQSSHRPDASEFVKVRSFCKIAKTYKVQYAWVDTCCIDKTSSAELTEAINSMYKWYQNAMVCIVYLADVPRADYNEASSIQSQIQAFCKSRWFTRGWTLQELIACSRRAFFAEDWSYIDDSTWDVNHLGHIFNITGIDIEVLLDNTKLGNVCVAQRMSWAANRQTTRPEDRAYSLMGLFNVNMAILYGEGLEGAFKRLQNEILKISFDQTLFAWRNTYEYSGLLARCPEDFVNTPELGLWRPDMLAPTVVTNIGTLIKACVVYPGKTEASSIIQIALQCDVKTSEGWMGLLIRLRLVQNAYCYMYGERRKAYRRIDCDAWETASVEKLDGCKYVDLLVLEDENYALVLNSLRQDRERWSTEDWGTQSLRLISHSGGSD